MKCVFCDTLENVMLLPYQGESKATCAWVCEDCIGAVPGGLEQDYLRSRLVLGNSHNFALMAVTRQAPMLRTNTRFLSGFGANGAQFEGQEVIGDHYASIARENGVDPKGKVYLSGLASFPGDPMAWVSDRDEAIKKAELRGWSAEGDGVKVKPRMDYETPHCDLAPEIVQERLEDWAMDHPEPQSITKKDVEEAKDHIVQTLTPRWGKHEIEVSV